MDSWKPGSELKHLQDRAQLLAFLREFFDRGQVTEVETPALARSTVTDINIQSITAEVAGETAYLQTSPEYFMKRLLAAGSGDIYSLGKAFRDAELGGRHNPEFTLLEWYRCDWDEHQLMDEVADLISQLFLDTHSVQLDITKCSYRDCFSDFYSVDPHQIPLSDLQQMAVSLSSDKWVDESRSNCLDLLFSLSIEPQLPQGLVFIYDYPACQAALALTDVNAQGQRVAHRFELFLNRMELANGYLELTDAVEQKRRFNSDIAERTATHRSEVSADSYLIAALESGLPYCSGVALGVDRLLMQLYNLSSIDQAMSFSWGRC